MAKWIDVGAASDLTDGDPCAPRVVSADQKEVVLCHVEGRFHATSNICPHAGMPIGMGQLSGCVLTCPFHGFSYNVTTGKNVDFEDDVPLVIFGCRKSEAGRVEVDIDAGSADISASNDQ